MSNIRVQPFRNGNAFFLDIYDEVFINIENKEVPDRETNLWGFERKTSKTTSVYRIPAKDLKIGETFHTDLKFDNNNGAYRSQ